MDPGSNSNPINNPSSLSRRQLRPVLSQAHVAGLWIEANDRFWKQQFGCVDHYLAYDAQRRRWQKYQDGGGHIGRNYGNWECDARGEPYAEYRPLAFFDLVRVINPLLDTASPRDQQRLGSYGFMNGVIRLLEHDERIAITARDLREPPRPVLDMEWEERRANAR
jgi:hypothetical protein